jgi:ribosome maturation factor RimP
VEVLFNDGKKITGVLRDANDTGILVEFEAKEKPDGAKRPKWVVKTEPFGFDVIKSVKEVIVF